MRILAISDLHTDYAENAHWVEQLSRSDHQDDVLLVAGDISDRLSDIERTLSALVRRFSRVMYVPGNHDLWLLRDREAGDSLQRFAKVRRVAESTGVAVHACEHGGVRIVPLAGWYDGSFGVPCDELRGAWMDYIACRWPAGYDDADVACALAAENPRPMTDSRPRKVITFSHFVPRTDLLWAQASPRHRMLYPVLGSTRIETALRHHGAAVHVYGHSHVNQSATRNGVVYINCALGYPREHGLSTRSLHCVHDDESPQPEASREP